MCGRFICALAALALLALVQVVSSGCARTGEKLPGDFPPGLTTYPGSQIVSQSRLGPAYCNSLEVALVTPASLRHISIFYFEQAQSIGLEVIADFDLIRMFDYYFGNDDYIVNIRASLEDNGLVHVYLTGCLAYECPYDTGHHFEDIFMAPASAREIDHMRMGDTYLVCFKSVGDYEKVLSSLNRWWHSGGWEYVSDSESEYRGRTLREAVFTRGEDTITCYIGESLDGDTACLVELFRGRQVR